MISVSGLRLVGRRWSRWRIVAEAAKEDEEQLEEDDVDSLEGTWHRDASDRSAAQSNPCELEFKWGEPSKEPSYLVDRDMSTWVYDEEEEDEEA